jgi:hypothetical protein
MGYKYRQGETPDHVNSKDSTSTPTPSISPRDNTRVAGSPDKASAGKTMDARELSKKVGLNLSGEPYMDVMTLRDGSYSSEMGEDLLQIEF